MIVHRGLLKFATYSRLSSRLGWLLKHVYEDSRSDVKSLWLVYCENILSVKNPK